MDRFHYTVTPRSPADAILTNMHDKMNVALDRAAKFGDKWIAEKQFNVYYNDAEVLGFVALDGMLSKTWRAYLQASPVAWCGNSAKVRWAYPKRPPKTETGKWNAAWREWGEIPKMMPWDEVSLALFGMRHFVSGLRIYSATYHAVEGQPRILSVPYVAVVGRTESFKRGESFKLCDGLVRMRQEDACAILYAPEKPENAKPKPVPGQGEGLFESGPQS